jgi:thiamine-monophosphate kinase
MTEFELINRFFKRPTRAALGVGDDCALLVPNPGYEWAISTDMLIEGRHFLPDVDPATLGHKALAVNLSDLAAMGARPVAFTLALSLPKIDVAWLAPFAENLLMLAEDHDCELIGGDTTRGPLAICITVFGEVGAGQALRRSAAQVGDEIWVSGTIGGAALGLQALRNEVELSAAARIEAVNRLEKPMPRVALGQALLGSVNAAIDLSDGLAGDLCHILEASNVGATVTVDRLPFFSALRGLPETERLRYALTGGDDYELCFTAPQSARGAVLQLGDIFDVPLARIGNIESQRGLRWIDREGKTVRGDFAGFDHFAQ